MGFPEDWQDLQAFADYQRWMMEQGYIYVGDVSTMKMKWVKPEN